MTGTVGRCTRRDVRHPVPDPAPGTRVPGQVSTRELRQEESTVRTTARAALGVLMSMVAAAGLAAATGGAGTARCRAGTATAAEADTPDPRSRDPWLREGDRTAGRDRAAGRQERQLHHRSHAPARAGDGRERRGSEGHRARVHADVGREHGVSDGHRARRRHVRHAGPCQSGKARCTHESSHTVDAQGHRVRAAAVRRRHAGPLHRRRRRPRPDALHDAREPDRAEADSR